jgi:BRCT domain type II-containing protein
VQGPAGLTAKRQAVKQSSSQAVKTAKRQTVKQSSSQKVQVTFYLSEEAAKELERVRFELLSKHDVRASRSAVAEQAILQAGAQLEVLAEALGAGE